MFKKLSLLMLPLILVSCATGHKYMRGSVTMKLDESTAHICLGDNEVKQGDMILFYYNDCEQYDSQGDGLDALCTLRKLGKGEITRIMGSHYSTVKTDGSFKFKEGTLVQIEKP